MDRVTYKAVKGYLDLFSSVFAFMVLSPLFILIAIGIKCNSSGPIIFRQLRVGLRSEPFYMYKFRSMKVDAEGTRDGVAHLNVSSGPIFKVKNDPRITPMGSILRRFSLDELSQIFNVIKGDMSLIGPRPLPAYDLENVLLPPSGEMDGERYRLWQEKREEVKPGITGLWQVSGRNGLPLEGWIRCDLEYVDRCSLGMDMRILLRTFPVILGGKGAY